MAATTLDVYWPVWSKQTEFMDSTATVRGFVAGQGAGKSMVGAMDLLTRALPGRLYVVTAPTYKVLRDATCRSFSQVASGAGMLLRPVGGESFSAAVRTTHGGRAEVLFRSTDNPDHLRGPNASGAWMDEASLSPVEAYRILVARLREAGELGWMTLTFTPKGRSHWTFEELATGKPGTHLIKARTRDNPFISADFVRQVERTYTGLLADQELGGEFVNVEGAEWPPEYFEDAPGSPLWFDDWPEGLVSRTIALDPSKGKDARKGDYAALVELAADRQGLLWCEADLVRGRSAEWVADWTVDRAARFRPDLAGVESNQFLQLFAVLIAQSASRRGRTLPLVEIHNHAPKLVRIRRLGPYLCQRRIRFRDTPGTRLLVEQLREFPEGEFDDAPDACEMALRLMEGLWVGAQEEAEDETVYRA